MQAPVHVTVQAIDSASFADRIQDYANVIAATAVQAVDRSSQMRRALARRQR